MQRTSLLCLLAACVISGGCTPQANLESAGDQRAMDAYAASKHTKPGRDLGFRWPTGNGVSQDKKLVKVEKIDARTSAFGKREIKCRLTTEVSVWKTTDGSRSGTPEIRKEVEERWLPVE